MPLDPDKLRISRDRITRVFRYLEALNQYRNPAKRQIREQLWVLWFRDLPDHPSIRRGSADQTLEPDERIGRPDGAGENNFVLKVKRPVTTQAPNPPEAIAAWLERGWEDPSGEVHIRESRNEVNDLGETRIVRFADDPKRLQTLESWTTLRDKWARNERPAREAMTIFEQLYELLGRIEREAERVELVLGDGILSWRRPDGGIYHPILLQRLQLEFDANVPEFTLLETEHEMELYSALFQSMPDVDGRAIARCREDLEKGDYHPLGNEATSGFLKRLMVHLSPRGEFIAEGAPRGETEDPRIGRDPVIFLRTRTLGFATAIEAVLEDLKTREDLPSSLVNVVGVEHSPETQAEDMPPAEPWNDPEDILFSKPANPEQIRIAERLEQHGNVLVQGPPGTGKSHTIANLIGHLLAQGKSVLVTSHATKALRVLREHVVEKLRPLCVSVLESDIQSQRQLQSSVEAIVERLSISDEKQLEAEAKALATQRRDLLAKLRKARQDLIDARGDEYRDVVIAGKGYPPSEAARKVAQEKGRNDWIPARVILGAAMPLSQEDLTELYRTNVTLSPEDEFELSQVLPNPHTLKTPDDFDRIIKEREFLAGLALDFRSDLWDSPPTADGLEEVEVLAKQICRAVEPLAGNDEWRLAVISAGQSRGPDREPWDNLLSMIDLVCKEAASAQETLLQHAPILSEKIPLEEQERILMEILLHLKGGGRLGRVTLLAHPSWNRFVQETRVDSGSPHLIEHFRALITLARLRFSRKELARRWDRQVRTRGAPSSAEFGDEVERACAQFSPLIRQCLDWYPSVWEPLEKNLKSLGFRWHTFIEEQPPNLVLHGELLRFREAVTGALQQVLSARANAIQWRRLEAELEDLKRTLAFASDGHDYSKVIRHLQNAISELDSKSYREAFQRLVDLHNRRSDLERRRELITRLETVAPAWAAAIRDRCGHHSGGVVPGDAAAAWLWRQLHDELERRGQTSLEQLQQTIMLLSDNLQQATAELIDRRAWAAQVRRTTLSQRQALIGWLDTVHRIGGGFVRRASRLRAEAARKMSECRTAVPVWIMPLARAVESFDPRTTRFDVIIIDEASQSNVMALLAFYLGRKIVVVGDDEQVSPDAVGEDQSLVQHLIDEHLQGIPNNDLYEGRLSVYKLARQSFGGTICLLEHFRCVPEIIQFSNQLSYDGRIKPLRDPSLVQLKPHVIAYRVKAAGSESKVNREEAWTVASLLIAATEQPEHKDKTFGVIPLVGDDQAREVERLLLRHLPPDEYQRRRVLCGNAAHFQGDERDVMFLSVIDTSQGDGPLPFRDQPMYRQRFNVAASRARDQMWVVHSLDPKNDLKPGDLRRRLIEHAEDPFVLARALEEGEQRVESELEKQVLRRLVQAGYRVVPQWRVGYYRIDLVVKGGGKRLAIECDGDRYHPIEKLPEDMARQAILERLGWRFSRIRGSQFFRDPDAAMEPIFRRLEALEIPPEGPEPSEENKSDGVGKELMERVIRRAEELRREWQGTGSPDEETKCGDSESEHKDSSGPHEEKGRDQRDTWYRLNGMSQGPPGQSSTENAENETKGKPDSDDDLAWVGKVGASTLRKLHRWATEKGHFQKSERSAIFWVAQGLDRKKKLSQKDAQKVRRLYETAVRKGFPAL